ncbi:MAG: hypothetical protein DRI69_09575 [Bacteroidetes bacterium]|nr:MAG: hypothetical protein DRI69_09575 [Bacteroidota bacterium]
MKLQLDLMLIITQHERLVVFYLVRIGVGRRSKMIMGFANLQPILHKPSHSGQSVVFYGRQK